MMRSLCQKWTFKAYRYLLTAIFSNFKNFPQLLFNKIPETGNNYYTKKTYGFKSIFMIFCWLSRNRSYWRFFAILQDEFWSAQKIERSPKFLGDWTQYSKPFFSRTPTIDGTDSGSVWPAFTSIEDSSLLHIDSARPKVVKNPFGEVYKFWSELPLMSRLLESTGSPKRNAKSEL